MDPNRRVSASVAVTASDLANSWRTFPTAGLPVPQRHNLGTHREGHQENSSLSASSRKRARKQLKEGKSPSSCTASQKQVRFIRSAHRTQMLKKLAQQRDQSLQSQPSFDFAQCIESFLLFVRTNSFKQIPANSDGVKTFEKSPSWSTLAYLASREKTLHEIPVGTILELYSIIVSQLDESASIGSLNSAGFSKQEVSVSLAKALNAAIVAIIIMSSDDINRCLILDDILEKTVSMIKVQTSEIIAPLFDKAARLKVTGADCNYWKSYEIAFSPCARTMYDLLRRLNYFYLREKIPESHAISVIDICCTLLRFPKDSELKNGAMWLLVTCFMQHESLREIIIEEITTMICSDGIQLSGWFRIDSKTSIHFPVAVALSLIQSLSTPVSDQQSKCNDTSEICQDQIVHASEQIELFNRTLVLSLMNKALKAGRSLSDSRASLQLFLDDLFACLFLPAWPAAEILLITMFQFLRNMFSKENVNNSRVIAVELLGCILTKLQNHIIAVQRDVAVIRPRTDNFNPNSSIHSNPEEEKLGCECGSGVTKDRLMLDCDECHYWFHGKCVDITEDNMPDAWICSSCELRHSIEQQRSVMKHVLERTERKSNSLEISENDVLFQVLLNYFSTSCIDYSMRLSKSFMLTLWCQRVKASDPAKASLFYSFFANEKFAAANQDLEGTSRIKSRQAYRIIRLLSQKYSLLQDSDMLLKVFVNMLNDKQPALRSRVVKALSLLVEANVDILGHDYVIRAISAAVQDKATSVREAAIEILGKKMLVNSTLSEKYYPIVAGRIRDKGLSVRKRCIKILRDICIEYPDHSKYVDICTKLVCRTQDEPSIRQLVQKALQDLWFSQFIQSSSRKSSSSGAFLPGFEAIANKIVDVVASLTTLDWLSEIITSAADSGSESHNASIIEVYSDFCSCIVQEMITFSSPSESLHHIRTLYVFCHARPVLLLEHLSCLQPMLKVERSGAEQNRLSLLCSIFLMALPFLENPRQRLVENLSSDLKELILQQSASVLLNAVPCLCVLSLKIGDFSLPQQLLRSFFQYLCQYKANPTTNGRVIRSVIRSLISVGLLVRNFDFESDEKMTYENIIMLYKAYFEVDDSVIRRTALQGLFYCYYRKPSFLASTYEIVISALAVKSDLELHAQVFHSFADFLQNESDLLKYLQGVQGDSEAHRLHGSRFTSIKRDEGETESGVIVSIVQKLFPSCISHVYSTSAEVRYGILRVTQLLLKQRLVNPVHCAPALIALCTDQSERISNLALVQISDMSVSFPDMLRNSVIDGVKAIANYQKSINGSTTMIFENEYPLGLFRFFQIVSKISRNMPSVYVGILNLIDFESNDSLISVEFITALLSGLSFQNDEPLHLYQHVARLTGVHGASVAEQFRSVLKSSASDPPEGAHLLCLKADKIEILMQFKQFLQDTFNISDALLDPTSGQSKATSCSRKDNSSRFTPRTLRTRSVLQTVDQLTQRYKSFKKFFNGDVSEVSVDYAMKTKSNRRKTCSPKIAATPKRGRTMTARPMAALSEGEPDSDFDDEPIILRSSKRRRSSANHKPNTEPLDSSSAEAESSI